MEKLRATLKYGIFFYLAIIGLSKSAYSQTYNDKIASYITQVEHPFKFLQHFENMGVKESGTHALDTTFKWLNASIRQLGYNTKVIPFLNGKDTLKNIEFVKKGSWDSCIIVCAHYDSWTGPGVNDNGTGDFALYQFAKWIKELNTKFTIRFLYFSGEELGYLGSRHYVANLNKDSVKIKYVINFDQLGGTIGEDNSGIKCERDDVSKLSQESYDLTGKMAAIYSLYTKLVPVVTPAYSSDYISFRDSGYIISGVYQYSGFPYYHSTSDLLNYIEFNSLTETVKGALAFLLYLTQADVPLVNNINGQTINNLTVYTTQNGLELDGVTGYNFRLFDASGKLIVSDKCESNHIIIPTSGLGSGIYYVSVFNNNRQQHQKIFISH